MRHAGFSSQLGQLPNGISIGISFFDNKLVGVHWSFILVGAVFVQFARRHTSFSYSGGV